MRPTVNAPASIWTISNNRAIDDCTMKSFKVKTTFQNNEFQKCICCIAIKKYKFLHYNCETVQVTTHCVNKYIYHCKDMMVRQIFLKEETLTVTENGAWAQCQIYDILYTTLTLEILPMISGSFNKLLNDVLKHQTTHIFAYSDEYEYRNKLLNSWDW